MTELKKEILCLYMQDLHARSAFDPSTSVSPVLENYINNAKQSLFSEEKWLE